MDYGSTSGKDMTNSLVGLKTVPLPTLDGTDNTPTFLGEPATHVMRRDTRGAKGSILAEEFIEQLSTTTSRENARAVANAVLMQAIAFFSLVAFSGVTPFMKRKLMVKTADGRMETPFLPTMLYGVDFLLSIVLGNLFSLIFYGVQGWKDCYNLRAVSTFCPVMCLASLSEILQIFVLFFLDGTSWRIVKQLKLPFTAVGVYVLLGRRSTTATQWALIVAVSVGVFGYCLQSNVKPMGTFSYTGVFIALGSITLTTFAGIFGDYAYKTVKFPMCTQIAQGRMTSFTVCLIFTLIYAYYKGELHKFPFGGYSWGALALSPWLTLKDWTGSFVLKHLDSVWKSLAGVLSVCVAYLLDLTLANKPFSAIALCFVIGVMINIFTFALTKRDQSEYEKLKTKRAS